MLQVLPVKNKSSSPTELRIDHIVNKCTCPVAVNAASDGIDNGDTPIHTLLRQLQHNCVSPVQKYDMFLIAFDFVDQCLFFITFIVF